MRLAAVPEPINVTIEVPRESASVVLHFVRPTGPAADEASGNAEYDSWSAGLLEYQSWSASSFGIRGEGGAR
jgi:hypothetical protein